MTIAQKADPVRDHWVDRSGFTEHRVHDCHLLGTAVARVKSYFFQFANCFEKLRQCLELLAEHVQAGFCVRAGGDERASVAAWDGKVQHFASPLATPNLWGP